MFNKFRIDLKKVNIHFAIEQLRINDFKSRNSNFVKIQGVNSKTILAAQIINRQAKMFLGKRNKLFKVL